MVAAFFKFIYSIPWTCYQVIMVPPFWYPSLAAFMSCNLKTIDVTWPESRDLFRRLKIKNTAKWFGWRPFPLPPWWTSSWSMISHRCLFDKRLFSLTGSLLIVRPPSQPSHDLSFSKPVLPVQHAHVFRRAFTAWARFIIVRVADFISICGQSQKTCTRLTGWERY